MSKLYPALLFGSTFQFLFRQTLTIVVPSKQGSEEGSPYMQPSHTLTKTKSAYITPDELQQVCEKFGLENVQLEHIIREDDQDNDGRIDHNEFVAMMQDTGFAKKGLQK